MVKNKETTTYFVVILCSAWILLLSGTTYDRNFTWQDDSTLWKDVITKSPAKWRGYGFLGIAYADLAYYDAAKEMFNTSLALNEPNPRMYNNRANLLLTTGHLEAAIADYAKAIELDPEFDRAYRNRGVAFLKMGRRTEAIADLQHACDLGNSSSCILLEELLVTNTD